jgi:hypothetical protein
MSESRLKLRKAKEAVREVVTGVTTIDRIRAADLELSGCIPAEIVELLSADLLLEQGWAITSNDDRCTSATKFGEERELELRLDRVNRRAVMLILTKKIVVEADDEFDVPVVVRQRGEVRNSHILGMI